MPLSTTQSEDPEDQMTPTPQPKALELAHRICWRYKHSSTYTFNEATMLQFAEALTVHARAEIEALRKALNALYITAPTSLECQHFHHGRLERHAFGAECGPREKYLEALRNTEEALKGASP